MNDHGRTFLHGIYVTPEAVAQAPEYARLLAEKYQVQLFVLRTGFNPETISWPLLEVAANTLKKLDAEICFLVGAWWGEGVNPETGLMRGVSPWRTGGPTIAHESQWRMHAPGGPADDRIEAILDRLIKDFEPQGVCLTHARYRHPADIPGLFEVGDGGFAEKMQMVGISAHQLGSSTRKVEAELRKLKAVDLTKLAQNARLPEFLDRLVGAQIFSTWFELRGKVVQQSLQRFRSSVRNAAGYDLSFGVNAYAPFGADLCGQQYASLATVTDFVQPLLGYMRWHVLQPLDAWKLFLLDRVKDLDEPSAIAIVADLFNLKRIPRDLIMASLEASDEGSQDLIRQTVEHQLEYCRATNMTMFPVLRGTGWPGSLALRLSNRANELGFAGVIFQGTEAIAGPAPTAGWQ
jgi:hypothetical protein